MRRRITLLVAATMLALTMALGGAGAAFAQGHVGGGGGITPGTPGTPGACLLPSGEPHPSKDYENCPPGQEAVDPVPATPATNPAGKAPPGQNK